MKTSSGGNNDNDKPAAEQQTELAAAPKFFSDVAAAPIIDAAALELPSGSGDDDAPLTPHQIAERYKRMEEGISEEKVEETDITHQVDVVVGIPVIKSRRITEPFARVIKSQLVAGLVPGRWPVRVIEGFRGRIPILVNLFIS